jgi:hypothetical protein
MLLEVPQLTIGHGERAEVLMMMGGGRRKDGRRYNFGPLVRLCLRCGAQPGKRCRNIYDVPCPSHDVRRRPLPVGHTPYVLPTKAERLADYLCVVYATPSDFKECPR